MNTSRTDARAEAAERLARLGGKMALTMFREAVVTWKSDGSMLTDADLRIQRRLEMEIAALFPGDGVLGEESEAACPPSGPRDWWVIDPIDGTNNFGRRLPGFSVSVGVLRDGLPYAGAIYDPVADWLFAARRGQGAWLNGERLAVSAAAPSPRSLFALRAPLPDGVPPFVEGWLRRYRLRRFGSTALHLCYVATGGLAFVHDHRASLWDVAGAALVVTEAGGVFTRDDGSAVFPVSPPRAHESIAFLAGDPGAHRSALADILLGHGRRPLSEASPPDSCAPVAPPPERRSPRRARA